LLGVVTLDDIRQIMFDQSQYDKMHVYELMSAPREIIHVSDSMAEVMIKFDESGAWDLPVVEAHKYVGFVSKSKLFSAYRDLLRQFSQEDDQ
jgi:CIC family chloride channel protein